MENKKFRIIVTALVPKSINYDGKTGGLVRLVEILKRFNGLSGIKIVIVSTKHMADYFKENGILADFRIVKSNLKFKNLWGLCLKALMIIIKSLFVLKHDFLKNRNVMPEAGQPLAEKIIVYSSSDLFWEVIPAFFYKTRNKNIKWVQVIHHIYPNWKARPGNKIINFFGYYLQRFSLWLIRKKANRIILVSESIKGKLVELGFPEDKMVVSSNGVDIGYFENIKKAESGYDGVFLARLSYSKGILDLIDVWKNVCDELPQAKLAIIGGGSEEIKRFLSKKITGYNLEKNIDLPGFLKDEKAYSILKSGKVFLFPSHEEGWGISIAEAMACGLPVVSWNLPAYKEVFGEHTLQTKEGNERQFSKNILDLLKNDTKRKKIGDRGKEFIKRYSWDNVAEKELGIICF